MNDPCESPRPRKRRPGDDPNIQAWQPFHPEMGEKNLHPHAPQLLIRDAMEEIIKHCDGPACEGESDNLVECGRAAAAFRRIFEFIVRVDLTERRALQSVGLRAVAAAWVIDPALFETRPSLSELAKQLGFTSAALSTKSAAFSREFGVSNNFQAHAHGGGPGRPAEADGDDDPAEADEQEGGADADE